MKTNIDKQSKNKNNSSAPVIKNEQNQNPTFQFVDNRPEAMQMRELQELANSNSRNNSFQFVDNRPKFAQMNRLQELANNSPKTKKLAQLQKMANSHAIKQELPVQKKPNNTGLPNNIKAGIENLSDYSMDDVKVHYNSDKPAQLNAHAYAQGTDIHLASGQEKYLPHDAWHVVQQKQGRMEQTMQMKGKVNDVKTFPIQRKLAYNEIPKVDEENTIKELKQTQNGKALVEAIEENKHKCTVYWAGPKDIRYAEPASVEDAKNPLKGSDVKVNIPKIEDDYGKNEKNQKLMVDQFHGDNKQTAVVVAHHELVHARAAMEGKMESGKNEVVHTVWKKNDESGGFTDLFRKEIIPLEEILTVGIHDEGNFKHEFHDLSGKDIGKEVTSKSRNINENTLRKELKQGVKLAYVADDQKIPNQELETLKSMAEKKLKSTLDEINEKVDLVKMYKNLVAQKTGLSKKWKARVQKADKQIEGWKTEVKGRFKNRWVILEQEVVKLSHSDWLKKVEKMDKYHKERGQLFNAKVVEKWRNKYREK